MEAILQAIRLYRLIYSTNYWKNTNNYGMQSYFLADDTPLPRAVRGGAWLIGNFDGVHKGHKAMIAEVRARYGAAKILTFDPHPRAFFGQALLQLTSRDEKLRLLAGEGVEVCVVRRFDASFAAHTAGDFITRILKRQLGAQTVAVGSDFRFGARRGGDVSLLEKHMHVHVFTPFCDEGGAAYSSTRIRALLADGNVAAAERLLGHGVNQGN